MGKGKGPVDNWVVQVSAGMLLLEFCAPLKEKQVREVLKVSAAGLSLTTKVVFFKRK